MRHLVIGGCPYLTAIEISAPNLISFTYQSDERTNAKFYVKNVPKLVELSFELLNSSKKLKPSMGPLALYLLGCFSHIQKLELICNKGPDDFAKFIELTSVKHLTLRYAFRYQTRILAWTPILKAFPALQKLTLDMEHRYFGGTNGVVIDHDKFPIKCLKELEFLGFGMSNDSELVMYFLKNIVRLENITLHCGGKILTWIVKPNGCVKAANLASELKQMIPKEVNLKFIGCGCNL